MILGLESRKNNKDIICIRHSIKKYGSENNELGIIKSSGYSTGYLNRQIISLLNLKNEFLLDNIIKKIE